MAIELQGHGSVRAAVDRSTPARTARRGRPDAAAASGRARIGGTLEVTGSAGGVAERAAAVTVTGSACSAPGTVDRSSARRRPAASGRAARRCTRRGRCGSPAPSRSRSRPGMPACPAPPHAPGAPARRSSSLPEPLAPERAAELLPTVRGCAWVMLGGQTGGDFPAETIALLAGAGHRMLSGRPGAGPRQPHRAGRAGADRRRGGGGVAALKLNAAEAGCVQARSPVPELLVTMAERGCTVTAGGIEHRRGPASGLPFADPTGAGDSFCALYCLARSAARPRRRRPRGRRNAWSGSMRGRRSGGDASLLRRGICSA